MSTVEELTDLLSDQFSVLYGAEPRSPAVVVAEDRLVFSFGGGLLPADEVLLRSERSESARSYRIQSLQLICERMRDIVEGVVERGVVSCTGAFDAEAWLSSCTFVLGEQTPAAAEERQALRSWGEQVVRNTRAQRVGRQATRQENRELIEKLKQTRRELTERPS